MACNSGMQRGILISLDTNDFRVEHKDGKAEVHLSRTLTNAQARELADKLMTAAAANEEMEKAYNIVIQSNDIPLPPGVTFVSSENVKVGHGG